MVRVSTMSSDAYRTIKYICCQEMGELNQKLDGKNFNIFGQLFTNSVEYIMFT